MQQIPGGALDLVPLIPVAAIMVWGAVWTLKSQIGQAFAERIRGSGSEQLQDEVMHLREEIVELRAELELTNERVDFAERVLTQGGEVDKHPTPV